MKNLKEMSEEDVRNLALQENGEDKISNLLMNYFDEIISNTPQPIEDRLLKILLIDKFFLTKYPKKETLELEISRADILGNVKSPIEDKEISFKVIGAVLVLS